MYKSLILGVLTGTLAVVVLAWTWPARPANSLRAPLVLRLDDYASYETGHWPPRPAVACPAPDLDKPLGEFVVSGASLPEVVDLLAKKMNANIVLDWPYLVAVQGARINLRQCTGRDVLDVLKKTHNLNARIDGNILYLSRTNSNASSDTEERATSEIEVRLYDVRDLLAPWGKWESQAAAILSVPWVDPVEEVCDVLAVCCAPASLLLNVYHYGGILVVRATPEVHRRVERSLNLLRSCTAGNPTPQTRPIIMQNRANADSAIDGASSSHLTIYDVRDILLQDLRFRASNNAPSFLDEGDRGRHLTSLIKDCVEPDSWIDNGGADGMLDFWAGRLVVRQTPAIHRKLELFLAKLREAN